VIAAYNGDVSAWLTFWVVAHALLQAIALVNIARKRHITGTRLVVKWTLLVLLIPVLGFLGYYFHLMEEAIERRTTGRGYQEDVAPFLQSFRLAD
jgi:hypothetical protein